jgi:catechol 2,3-dioxygenase-like lactoylglutathione lyase family enzyme
MDQRADFITVATSDLDAARAFYVGGLGWTPTLDVPGEIIFFQIGYGTMLGLYEATSFRTDLDPHLASDTHLTSDTPIPISGVTLSHNVDSPDEVDRVIAAATGAGATVIKRAQRASFGG